MAVTGLKVRLAGAWVELPTIAGLTPTTDNMIQSVAGAWASRTPAQVKAALAIVQADVSGLPAALDSRITSMVWNGSAYVAGANAVHYVGPVDPGAVPNGSIWTDTSEEP